MFIVKDLETDTEDRFETRDQLLAFLDIASARVRQAKSKEEKILEHFDQDGKQLEKTTISLPIETDADAYLINFGKLKDKSGFPFPRRPSVSGSISSSEKSSKEEVPVKKTKQEAKKPLSIPYKQEIPRQTAVARAKRPSLIVFLFLLWSLGVAALGSGLYQERQTTQSLTNRVSQLETLQKKIPAIDAFSRFFLPNYFTGNQKYFSEYLSTNLQKKSLDSQTGTLQSVILEGITYRKKGYQVSYVLSVKKNGDTRETLRLAFTVKVNPKAAHGYEVISSPKSSNYPK